jgi:CRP/FNR family transcriptional regulator, cyclic AMP receptor protein
MTNVRISRQMKRDALLASHFFSHMSAEELDEIIGFAVERRLPRGTSIFSKGDAGSSMMAVLAGRVRISAVSADGKEVTLNVIGPGEIFGEIALLDGKPRSADATAVEDTVLMEVERKRFLPFLLKNEALVERLLVVLCDRLRRTSLVLEEIALFDLPSRLARLLVKLSQDYGRPAPVGGVRIDMKLSQRDLATLVASSRETVNKQLRGWREQGMVDQLAGYLVVRDARALERLVG